MIDIAAGMWSMLGGDEAALHHLSLTGPNDVLPCVYDVTGFATAAAGVANLAAAELLATRTGSAIPAVTVRSRQACAAFLSERLFTPLGWERPAMWDPIAGDYQAADGWIRLHTNYAAHRLAAQRALELDDPDRDEVAAAVAKWAAEDLEACVVDAGGCAAVMHTRRQWLALPQGQAVALEPALSVRRTTAPVGTLAIDERPLGGLRVLDLTRVIAGPVCTRFLAAYGAQVLRIDPPRFEEVPAVVPETSAGKRTTFLDLAAGDGRARFDELLGEADVVVHGLRPGALAELGFDAATMRARNPRLIVAQLDAYGWRGPWSGRRGFDSLVQMSCGIAAEGARALGTGRPVPLPAQALDHGTGFLLAAAICRAVTSRQRESVVSDISASLIGTANLLMKLPVTAGPEQPEPHWGDDDTEPRRTAWGPARAVPIPGLIDGVVARLHIEPGPLGRHEPTFA